MSTGLGSRPAREAYDRITGRTHYIGDLRLPGMVWAHLITLPSEGGHVPSEQALATARALPGVLGVFTPNQLSAGRAGHFSGTEPGAFSDALTGAGAPAAVVAAIGDTTAREAARVIEVGNGPPARGMPLLVLSPPWHEPKVILAAVEPDRVTVWSGDEDPFGLRVELAGAFRLQANQVRVIYVPAGWGARSQAFPAAETLAVHLAGCLRRPVRLEMPQGACGAGLPSPRRGEEEPARATALVRLHRDGSATVLQGMADQGRGLWTMLAQVAGDALGIDPGRIEVSAPDTALVPAAYPSDPVGSGRAAVAAVRGAAAEITARAGSLAAAALGVSPAEVEIIAGGMRSGGRHIAYPEIIRRHFGMAGGELVGLGQGRGDGPDQASVPMAEGEPISVEVAVDLETGEWRVERIATTLKAGRRPNPLLWTLAAEGAVAAALSATRGRLTFRDAPESLRVTAVERHADLEALPAAAPLRRAVQAAIGEALGRKIGMPVVATPASPETLWRLLQPRDQQR